MLFCVWHWHFEDTRAVNTGVGKIDVKVLNLSPDAFMKSVKGF